MSANKFNIVEIRESSALSKEQLERILGLLPIDFQVVNQNAPRDFSNANPHHEPLEVYHSASVISIYPQKGKRLYCATLTDMDFPIRPDNIMDDQLGLRSCFHPRLESFGIKTAYGNFASTAAINGEIEIDIYKYATGSR